MTSILPSKLLKVEVTNATALEVWEVAGDDYEGYPYKWEVSMNVYARQHSHLGTEVPLAYTGMDIKVGDWIGSDSSGGVAWKIISISMQDYAAITCVVEDIERYNTFNDPTQSGNGSPNNGYAFVFEVSEDGLPVLAGVEANLLPPSFQTDLLSRFLYRNTKQKFIPVMQAGHNMNIGDPIVLNADGTFSKAYANPDAARMVGIVTSINVPSVDWFTFRPIGAVVENIFPVLPGSAGSVIYLGTTPGSFTATRPTQNAKPVYIQLDVAGTKGVLLQQGVVVEPSTTKNFLIEVDEVNTGTTTFTLPSDAKEVIEMAINGVELRAGTEFTFNSVSQTVTIVPEEVGYGVEEGDELTFLYKN